MGKRVEICGINTSELPKLSHKETIELLKRAQSGDSEARDAFLLANMRLVLSIVGRFHGKKESADDIFQVGCIGLIKAMENFDPGLNLRFSTYAVPDDHRRDPAVFARLLAAPRQPLHPRHRLSRAADPIGAGSRVGRRGPTSNRSRRP